MKWNIIFNPESNGGKASNDWFLIKELLEQNNIEYNLYVTEYSGHAYEISYSLVEKELKYILSVGGDGTFNEVINGCLSNEKYNEKEYIFAQIPLGTGNDYRRSVGISIDLNESIRALQEKKYKKHDIGLVHYYKDNKKYKRYFINALGFGYDATVVKLTNKIKSKGKGNKMSYLYATLKGLFSYSFSDVTINIDEKRYNYDLFSGSVGIGKFIGGGMKIFPNAITDDGLFEITLIKKISKLNVIRNMKIMYNGKILDHPLIDGFRGTYVKVKSNPETLVEVDGENLCKTPIIIEILKQKINVVYL